MDWKAYFHQNFKNSRSTDLSYNYIIFSTSFYANKVEHEGVWLLNTTPSILFMMQYQKNHESAKSYNYFNKSKIGAFANNVL